MAGPEAELLRRAASAVVQQANAAEEAWSLPVSMGWGKRASEHGKGERRIEQQRRLRGCCYSCVENLATLASRGNVLACLPGLRRAPHALNRRALWVPSSKRRGRSCVGCWRRVASHVICRGFSIGPPQHVCQDSGAMPTRVPPTQGDKLTFEQRRLALLALGCSLLTLPRSLPDEAVEFMSRASRMSPDDKSAATCLSIGERAASTSRVSVGESTGYCNTIAQGLLHGRGGLGGVVDAALGC